MMDKVMCLYGSVTGKAMSIAEQIVELGTSKGVEVGRGGVGWVYTYMVVVESQNPSLASDSFSF